MCQIYVDDIIFGSTNHAINVEFENLMTKEFAMSMMGELKFFLGFQVKQLRSEETSSTNLVIFKTCSRGSKCKMSSP